MTAEAQNTILGYYVARYPHLPVEYIVRMDWYDPAPLDVAIRASFAEWANVNFPFPAAGYYQWDDIRGEYVPTTEKGE